MSGTKRLIDELGEYGRIAKKCLLEIGAIATCPFHDDYYYETNNLDENAIYGRATVVRKRDYPEMNNHELFTKEIKEILQSASFSSQCPFCDKNYKD